MEQVPKVANDYVTRVYDSPAGIAMPEWNALLASQGHCTPFMRHEYLHALHASGSAIERTGWAPHFVTLWQGDALQAACALYRKSHSYGEYVFDWAWANAYEQHGLQYFPKAVVAVPFTPVPGTRLLARSANARRALVRALIELCRNEGWSSLHLLFGADEDIEACAAEGLMLRHTVQFHWQAANQGSAPNESNAPCGFEGFLASLSQDKRKKIRQERRKVEQAGVRFRWARGTDISQADWDFFYRCYERTYLEHGNPPYLSRDFFMRMARDLPQAWLMFIAERDGPAGRVPMASSLIALSDDGRVAYGRYWGALERVDCLHFEACYYQPLQWCMQHGVQRFEGGAQGEHKMARALMPVRTTSAHWLAHPAFADAVQRFLDREGHGVEGYLEHLQERSPFRKGEVPGGAGV